MFQSCWIDVFQDFYLVIRIVFEAIWHSLKFPRDQSTKIRHVSLQMESMKLKRAEQGSWQTETIWHKNPEDCNEVLAKILFWTRFVRYNIVVAILDAWKSRKVFTTWSVEVSYRGCLKHRSHYLKPSWAVMPMSTCLKSNQTADVSQDFSQWVSRVWLSMTQKLLSRFWSWVMTWPLLLFDYVVFTCVNPAGLFHFEVSRSFQKSFISCHNAFPDRWLQPIIEPPS